MEIIAIEKTIIAMPSERFRDLLGMASYHWICPRITEDRFPVERVNEKQKIPLVVLHFGNNKRRIQIVEAIEWAREFDSSLIPPTPTDCLRFGMQHPDVQMSRATVFPHAPVKQEVNGDPDLLYLNRSGGRQGVRRLNAGWRTFDFSHGHQFAFRRAV